MKPVLLRLCQQKLLVRWKIQSCVVRQKFIDSSRIVLPPFSEQNGFSVTTARRSSLLLFTFLVISYHNFLVYQFTQRNNDHLLTENDDGIFHDIANKVHPCTSRSVNDVVLCVTTLREYVWP